MRRYIKVTDIAERRRQSTDTPLLNMVGVVVDDYDEFILEVVMDGKVVPFGREELKNHIANKDILVYFELYDFCYWLGEGEYEDTD